MLDSSGQTPESEKHMNISLPSTLKNPILDIAASFWDDQRYRAFRVCYRSMRIMDDLVDDAKSSGGIPDDLERVEISALLKQALESIENHQRTASDLPPEIEELRQIITQFKIPLWPWRRLAFSGASSG